MTTIAYRDGVMAADTLLTSGHSNRDGFATKAFLIGSLLVAWAGSCPRGQAFVDWIRSGAPEGREPSLGDEKGAAILIVMPDDQFITVTHGGWERWRAPYAALGMGSDYALGAMAFGADAESAVRAALRHECMSGGDVTVIRRPI